VPPSPHPVVVVAGPTAAGKSGVAIALAERFGGEIVNADSMQVYRHLDIGTAKPSLADRARVPHHLLDVVTPDVLYNAGR
jgi:tRNA dimethylallyltransferase